MRELLPYFLFLAGSVCLLAGTILSLLEKLRR